MASTHKSLRSSTANKRPTTAIADGQIALNTNATSPGLFFKDSAGGTIIKVGPVHVGTTAPNATPAAGGSSGNSTGEVWLDTSLTPPGVKIWSGGAWTNATPAGSTTVQGLLELATNAETQAGSDAVRAVTPASLQSKVSDSTSTTSSTTIASSTAVKSAYDLANAALPKTGGTVTGNVTFGTTGVLAFEGSTDDGFETAIGVSDPTADRVVTIPDQDGNFLISGNASIVNADVNASAAIAGTKISPNFGAQNVVTTGTSTAASFIPTSSTVPTNGVYLPAANSVALSTNGTGRLFVDSSGRVGIGTTSPVYKLVASNGGVEGIEFAPGFSTNKNITLHYNRNTSSYIDNWVLAQNHVFSNDSVNAEVARIDSSGRLLVGTSSDSGGALLQVNGDRIRVATAKTPASASDTGTTGEICWDASYIYVCTATNTWKRAALSTW